MKNKNEPNSSFKFGFLLVTLGENVANGLATKRSLIMRFGEWGGGWGGKWGQNDKKRPPTGKNLQIGQNFNMEALFFSRTNTTTYTKNFSCVGGFRGVVGPKNTLK